MVFSSSPESRRTESLEKSKKYQVTVSGDTDTSDSDIFSSSDWEAAQNHVFADSEKAQYYADIYENAKYEGRHLFDPSLTWQKKEERKLVRKTDLYVTLWAFIMFLALDIDRYNLTNAVAGSLLSDLKLTTNDYNLGSTVNLVCFLAAELPSQLISKWIGPDVWIPTQMVLWSIVAVCQCKMTSKSSFLACRALVGMLEGGFIPDICLWMSYFYKGSELSVRLGYFYIANPLTQAISALLAYGIYHLDGRGGWHGWQYVFLIEGLITLVIGVLSYFYMPASVVQTKAWYRPKGWYTDRQEKIMVNRVLRDDPSKGDMHNRQPLTPRLLLRSVLDYDLWPIYGCRLMMDIIAQPLSQYIPLLLKHEGLSTLNINLLMIPYCFLMIITMLSQAHLSAWTKQYAWWLMTTPLWLMPPIAAMKWWPGFLHKTWPSYIILFFALGYPPSWVLSISWCSHNSNSVRLRTVSAAVVNMCSQSGSIIGTNLFRKDDAPRYQRGLQDIFGISIGAIGAVIAARYYYIWRNKQRQKKWDAMTVEQQNDYIKNTTDKGNKRLDFRFVY